ncbi:MAG: PilZ domain-containing protein [Acidobacteriia bacterium]|nr:PilZ domain-containing protein [Terriglobia bacterium]
MSDSRTGRRFPLELPISIRDKKTKKLKGTTSNVSAAGVYMQARADLELGSKVKFEIMLPGSMIGAKKDVAIECSGRVVRCSDKTARKSRSKGPGLACVIDSYKFVRK